MRKKERKEGGMKDATEVVSQRLSEGSDGRPCKPQIRSRHSVFPPGAKTTVTSDR